MAPNPQRRAAWIWLSISFVGLALLFLPPIAGIDGMNGGFALQFISIALIIPAGIVGAYLYFRRARVLDRIRNGTGLLARWSYDPVEWARYTEAEVVRDRSWKIGLFWIISGWSLFFGVLFLIFDRKAGFAVFLVMLGLIALVGATAALSIWLPYRRNRRGSGEALIHPEGVFLNGALHAWGVGGATLDEVLLHREEGLILSFSYSFPAKGGRDSRTVNVPVPLGKEEEADRVVRHFRGE
ncbi:MAG: hypothetical protein ACOYXN_00710 [Acidobacteriota bacterium]